MYKYKVSIYETQSSGTFDIYVQYINSSLFELYAEHVDIVTILNGVNINVDTVLKNVKVVNTSPCCVFEDTLSADQFLVK